MDRSLNYISAHLFYNARDLRPVVLGCIDPLVNKLKRTGLISSFFFVRYWEGGSHVRLRLRAAEEKVDAVRQIAAVDISAFFIRHPSMFDADRSEMRAMIRLLFEFEFGKEVFKQKYNSDEDILIYDNNSYHFIDYKPEFLRYGGRRGIELAHQNFHISSMIAIRSLSENNARMERMVLGIAFQMTLHFAYTFFRSLDKTREFFIQYVEFFSKLSTPSDTTERINLFFARQAKTITGYVDNLNTMHERIRESLHNPLGEYIRHAEEMRDTLLAAYANGELEFSFTADNVDVALFQLVTSYIHMNNNRLGLLIFEETYIATLIVEALRERG